MDNFIFDGASRVIPAEKCDKIGSIKKINKNDVIEILKLTILAKSLF